MNTSNNKSTKKYILFVFAVIFILFCVLQLNNSKYSPSYLHYASYLRRSSINYSKKVVDDPCEKLKDLELFLRMYHQRKPLYEYVFLKSLSIFWPCREQLRLVIVLDNESKADHEWAKQLESTFPYPRVMFDDPSDIYHGNGHIRQQVSMFHAEKYTNATYVGFVDSDTLFVTMIAPGILFEDGKPSVIGRIGLDGPYWEGVSHNTRQWFGHQEVMKGMSYFPVIMKVEHLVDLRKWMENKHKMPFDKIFQKFSAGDSFSQFTIMCQYMWMFKRSHYSFHFEPLPDDKYDYNKVSKSKAPPSYYKENLKPEHWLPKPRSSIHWSYPEPNPPGVRYLSEKWLEAFIGEGFCYSIGLNHCPEKCKGHNFNKTQERLYRFEGPTWAWHPLALKQQQVHYEEVHQFVSFLSENGRNIMGFNSTKEACDNWPRGYNFVYPEGKVATRHFGG